ncbi:MAG: hypothetical protein FWG07_06435 [Treponema sp.]|nr:hypothetical protein [Treponema sp.]
MKKILVLCFLVFSTVFHSFAQIYKDEGITRNGTVSFSLHYIEYTDYRYLLYIDGVSIFIKEDQIAHLEAILEKFVEWEEMAAAEQISLTKTIDSITFTSFHFNHTFFRQPIIFYFVFTGGPIEPSEDITDTEIPPTRYTLFIDTTLEKIIPFRLSSKTIQDMQAALTPEKLSEAWDTYENQKALEEMFH